MNRSSERLQRFLGCLHGVKPSGDAYVAKCPGHDDNHASLFIKVDAKGNLIVKCFAGCNRKGIVEPIGWTESDLYEEKRTRYSSRQHIATYKYFDRQGNYSHEKRRYVLPDGDKTFDLCRFLNGTFIGTINAGWFEPKGRSWKRIQDATDPQQQPTPDAKWIDAAPNVLYHLSQLKKAAPGSLALLLEGEKDVENAERLGFLATTAITVNSWLKEHADDLAGLNVACLPDNDKTGRKYTARAARDLYGKAAGVRIVELPGLKEKGDLSDWFQAGGTKEQLLELIKAAPDYHPSMEAYQDWCPADGGETSEIDISSLEEIPDDDPPISDDPRREFYLRQLARNTAKVILACTILLRLFGFVKIRTRLLNALIAIGGDRLKAFWASQTRIRQYYAENNEASSEDTVRRDIKKLLEEQKTLGIEIISYTPGTMNLKTNQGYASKFQNHLLRYALQAINISLDLPDIDPNTGKKLTKRQKLEIACQQVTESVPRNEPQPKTDTKREKVKSVEEIESQLEQVEAELLSALLGDGWAAEEIEDEFNRLESNRKRRLQDALRRRKGEFTMGGNHATHSKSENQPVEEVVIIQ